MTFLCARGEKTACRGEPGRRALWVSQLVTEPGSGKFALRSRQRFDGRQPPSSIGRVRAAGACLGIGFGSVAVGTSHDAGR